MVAITTNPDTSRMGYLRPFDIRRDLNAVADLVELCFADTLDADGQRYLKQMRDAARNAGFIHWASSFAEGSAPLSGYVWMEDGRLVGNLSLIPYSVNNRRRYLIANVAVHPEYRRRGIARLLTREAQEYYLRKKLPPMWLHVREDNEAAKKLYVSLGFEERARRTTWHSLPEIPNQDQAPMGMQITARKPSHWEVQETWLARVYPAEFSWQLPLKISSLRPSFWESIAGVFTGTQKRHWAAVRGERTLAVLTWQSTMGYTDSFWLAAPPAVDDHVIASLLRYARLRLPMHRTISLDYPAHISEEAIRSAGFSEQQTLIWMESVVRTTERLENP